VQRSLLRPSGASLRLVPQGPAAPVLPTEPRQRLPRQFANRLMILGKQDGFRATQVSRFVDYCSFPC
jgi:hypothetical protein